jgi:aminoglycoside phosphotransferase (APT) family kinase protein
VRAAIAGSFPALRGAALRFLARGWDHDAWLADETWVFRFPRRRDVADAAERRRAAIERIASALPVAVPRAELAGRPGAHFPHPYAAHRFLPGEPADTLTLDDAQAEDLAQRLGPALAALHAIDPAGLDLPVEGDRNADRRFRVSTLADAFRACMPAACAARWEPVLAGTLEMPPAYPGPYCVTHNDLNAEHLLLEPRTRRLVAVIDWNDAALGDPAADFVGLWTWQGEPLVRRTLGHYACPWDEHFVARIRFAALCLPPLWIAESHHYGDRAERGRLRDWFLEVAEPRELATLRAQCDAGRSR